jgi:hypothetical protein
MFGVSGEVGVGSGSKNCSLNEENSIDLCRYSPSPQRNYAYHQKQSHDQHPPAIHGGDTRLGRLIQDHPPDKAISGATAGVNRQDAHVSAEKEAQTRQVTPWHFEDVWHIMPGKKSLDDFAQDDGNIVKPTNRVS